MQIHQLCAKMGISATNADFCLTLQLSAHQYEGEPVLLTQATHLFREDLRMPQTQSVEHEYINELALREIERRAALNGDHIDSWLECNATEDDWRVTTLGGGRSPQDVYGSTLDAGPVAVSRLIVGADDLAPRVRQELWKVFPTLRDFIAWYDGGIQCGNCGGVGRGETCCPPVEQKPVTGWTKACPECSRAFFISREEGEEYHRLTSSEDTLDDCMANLWCRRCAAIETRDARSGDRRTGMSKIRNGGVERRSAARGRRVEDTSWDWGFDGPYGDEDAVRMDIEGFLVNHLDNQLHTVTGPDGKKYRIAVKVELVPVA